MAGIYASLEWYNLPGRITQLPQWSEERDVPVQPGPGRRSWIWWKAEKHGGPLEGLSTAAALGTSQ